ncbi:MAG: hemerythrin domain-containing protein [Rhodobacteraceae bacterium]|nr:hemerythrin domain-containing protein [Paracoccaceae bacterium]
MSDLALNLRAGLPDALRVLLRDYPRDLWEAHRNFDGLTRFWLERHMMFRQVLGMWQQETRGFLDGGDTRAHGARTSQLGGFLLSQLQGHHQIEDGHYFPMLSRAEPRLSRGFALLDADHHALEAELSALAEAGNTHLAALAEGAGRDSAGALLARLDGFAPLLDRHLTDEEEGVGPVILHHGARL